MRNHSPATELRRQPATKPPLSVGRVGLAVDVLAALAEMPPTVATSELRERLGWEAAQLARVIASLKAADQVESWDDPDRPGSKRLMLSVAAIGRIGISLAPSGDRWSTNPDRKPGERIRLRGRPRKNP